MVVMETYLYQVYEFQLLENYVKNIKQWGLGHCVDINAHRETLQVCTSNTGPYVLMYLLIRVHSVRFVHFYMQCKSHVIQVGGESEPPCLS